MTEPRKLRGKECDESTAPRVLSPSLSPAHARGPGNLCRTRPETPNNQRANVSVQTGLHKLASFATPSDPRLAAAPERSYSADVSQSEGRYVPPAPKSMVSRACPPAPSAAPVRDARSEVANRATGTGSGRRTDTAHRGRRPRRAKCPQSRRADPACHRPDRSRP